MRLWYDHDFEVGFSSATVKSGLFSTAISSGFPGSAGTAGSAEGFVGITASISPCSAASVLLVLIEVFHAGVPMYGIPVGSSNMASVSSSDLPDVSGNKKKQWTRAAALNVPNIMYVLQVMFANDDGVNRPSAMLKIQFPEVARPTAFPRNRSGYSSGG